MGIPREDESGRVVDLHALRHTFLTNLARGGVHPKTAQALTRHSTITLTMDRYTHSIREEERQALSALPDLDSELVAVRATGTTGPVVLASCLASDRASSCETMKPSARQVTINPTAEVTEPADAQD